MNNILEVKDLHNFDYTDINLGNPTLLTNSNYYTKINYGKFDKNLYLQLSKCTSKQGIIKSGNKQHIDIMYNSSNTEIIKWFENFESYLQNKILNNKDDWFESDITLDDIQELMTPIMRSYKSGKCFLIRCYIKNSCNVYDEEENLLTLNDVLNTSEIIPLLLINGIKFSSKMFQIELLIPQIMIITNSEDLEKKCLIKTNKIKNNFALEKQETNVEDKEETNIEDKQETNVEVKQETNVEDKRETYLEDKQESDTEDKQVTDIKNNNLLDNIDSKILEENNDSLESINISEINLDTLEDKDESINIKNRNEVYYEIYKTAIKKAKEIKKNALQAFLEARNIQIRYNLDEINISDSEDDCENESNFN